VIRASGTPVEDDNAGDDGWRKDAEAPMTAPADDDEFAEAVFQTSPRGRSRKTHDPANLRFSRVSASGGTIGHISLHLVAQGRSSAFPTSKRSTLSLNAQQSYAHGPEGALVVELAAMAIESQSVSIAPSIA
jgi:hypothetical protein